MKAIDRHFKMISEKVEELYKVAREARSLGLDPVSNVETPIAISLAEKAIGLISVVYPQLQDEGLINRILELEKQYGQLTMSVCLGIAEDIAREKYCKFENLLQAIDAGIRVAFSYFTLGVVSSPIEGYTGLKTGKTRDGKDYFIPYFSGPIRSAGTTASCVALFVIDYLRELFGFAKYDPTEDEVKRYVSENYDYHERITNLQYLPSEDEITFLAKNMPIQIAGEPTEKIEVFNYKDLPRVETNFIRGGMCLIFSEGLAQKAAKAYRLLKIAKENGFKSTGWDFLEEYIEKIHKKKAKSNDGDTIPTYIKDIVAGRPVYSHPGRSGGFRFRYGRARTAGFSATAVHPATMGISNSFLSIGTQLKIEKPTKGCAISMVDSIDGPIVKLKNGSVLKPRDLEEAKRIYSEVEEIIYLGDILFPLGDVINRNSELLKPGYVEEWWGLEIEKAGGNVLDEFNVNFEDALKISEKYKVPLHPRFIYYWSQISYDNFLAFVDWITRGVINGGKLILPYNKSERERFSKGKRALELIGCEHMVSLENVILSEMNNKSLLFNLGIDVSEKNLEDCFDKLIRGVSKDGIVLEEINKLCKYKIKDKAGDFIGARMGRPEKAKLRKLTGSPHALFPVGAEGGRLRSFQAATGMGFIKSEFPNYYCKSCVNDTIYPTCEVCGKQCISRSYCFKCDTYSDSKCDEHGIGTKFRNRRIDSKYYMDLAKKKVGLRLDDLPAAVKGVRGTTSEDHSCENLAKGLLRAKYNLHVNKDGTIRYDITEMPITHFKSKEIGTSIEKLKELGYETDYNGVKLEDENQIIEIFPHDIILPSCPDTLDEKADDVFLRVSQFIDDELEKFYGIPRYYNAEKKGDLIGNLFACIAPHICTATVGRVIGFSKTQAFFASPYMHAAMRRDCFDYDSYIPIKNGVGWKIVKIGDYVESLNPQKVVDGFGTKEIKAVNVNTLGFNNGLKEVKVKNFTKHSSSNFVEVSTSLGKKIKVTEGHKFLIDGKIKMAKNLVIGDRIPLVKKVDIKSKKIEKINFLDYFKEGLMVRGINGVLKRLDGIEKQRILDKLNLSKKSFSNYFLRDSYPIEFILLLNKSLIMEISKVGKISTKRDNFLMPIEFTMSDEFLEIVGLYIADGYSRSIRGKKGLNQVYISSNDIEIRRFISNTMFKIFGLKPTERKRDRVTFSSKVLYLLFNKILNAGSIAKNKRVPSLFLDLSLNQLGCVLRGYFEGDGSAEKKRKRVSCDSISQGLLSDLEFCLGRFGIFVKRYEYEKEPGEILKEFYRRKKREIPKFKITKLIIGSDFVDLFRKNIGFLSSRRRAVLENYTNIKGYGMRIMQDTNFVYDPIVSIKSLGEKESYCLNVENSNHLVAVNSILSRQCDGDEAAVIFLADMLLNFSRKFLPSHRGGTQDSPLVLNIKINAGEVDDQILDLIVDKYPLELYEKAEERKHSSELKVKTIADRLKAGEDPFTNIAFTHNCDNFNDAVLNSSYKTLPTMSEKVDSQMKLCKRIRAVDTSDVARLVIERHFIRDIRGNLRKFSQQVFRCVGCNEKYRRPPLLGKCVSCGGRLIFTISEGSILKYMQAALDLARNYGVGAYLLENLEIVEKDIHSIFGKEKEKQMKLF
ncbi:MAG: DNA polymerase II large subunit [Candidatus Pacearchaeota archaeon]|nr:DNA polymerase II large subunit [Candidatus Pacearchaeota archaeon]